MSVYQCYHGENGILNKASSAKIEQAKAEMIESLKLKLMDVLTLDGGTPKLSSLDGLVVDGYQAEVSSLGRIVKMTKDSNSESYFVDDKFNVSQLGTNILTGTSSVSESTVINNINLVLSNIGRSTITVTANVDVVSGSSIKGYVYMINGDVIDISTSNTYTYQGLTQETTYNIEVRVMDNKGEMKSKNISGTTNSVVTARYLVFEVYDHLAADCAVINELEVYNSTGSLLSYSLLNVYDSVNSGNPPYWNSSIWGGGKLYDGQIAYASNAQGGSTSTAFTYNSDANKGCWARLLVDLGSNKILDRIKIVTGGVEERTPKAVNIYTVNSYSESTYVNNIAQRNDNGLSLLGTKTFTNILSTPTYFDLYSN